MKPESDLYVSLAEKARLIPQIEVLLRGDRHHTASGDAAAVARTRVDTSYARDGDPAQCAGWDALSEAEQSVLAADYAAWQAYVAVHGRG
jgi:hypothetical protein